MREMLEPIFGESGAVVAQFTITLIAVLVLIGLAYWVVQRFSGIRLNGAGRGRVPRLAILDALSIDGRRRLVLIRRDNVEHLILIGGTADLVVEPSIVRGAPAGARPRQGQAPRPQPQQAAAVAAVPQAPSPPPAAPPRAPETTGISEPVPFPPAQRPQPRQMPRGADTPGAEPQGHGAVVFESVPQRRAAVRMAPPMAEAVPNTGSSYRNAPASAHFEEPTRPNRIESVFSLADALDEIANEPISAGDVTEFAGPKARPAPHQSAEATAAMADATDDAATETLELSSEPAPAMATDDTAAEADDPQANQSSSASKVSDLEREMARLLGEITSRRES